MDELLQLLAQAENLADLNDEQLTELRDSIREQSDALLDGDPTDEELEALERAASTVEAIGTELETRETQAEERAQRAQALADRIRGQQEGEGEGDGEGDGEGGDEGADDAGADDAGEGADDAGEGDGDAADAPQAVAAGARRQPARVTRVAARRPAAMRPRQPEQRRELALVAAANLPNVQAGTPLSDPTVLGRAFIDAYEQARGYRGPRVKVPVATIGFRDPGELYGEERTLRMSSPEDNTRKVQQVTALEAITAAGGICAPTETRYDLPVLMGTDARPVRDDMLARFGADRGGVRTLPPPVLTDVAGAVSVWTHANDLDPSDPATKPCLTVTCPEAEETIVDAIVKCLEFGNFRARFFPEQVQSWLDLAAVQHAREAESRLLTSVGTGSTQVTSGQGLGAVPDVLATLERAATTLRNRHRLSRTFPLRFGAPEWLLAMLRVDLVRQMPGGGTLEERYAIADATITRFITNLNINVTWFLDGESGQVFGAQGDGPLIGWPSTVVTYLYPEGSWLFLDGGQLDLGIVRDSTLNSTNDYQVFAETFENVHFHGVESMRLTMDLCPDGSVAGTVDFNPCAVGS